MTQPLNESIIASAAERAFSTPMQTVLADLRKEHGQELSDEEFAAVRNSVHAAVISKIKDRHPEWKLFLCPLPKSPDELFIGRQCSWFEYKTTIKRHKNDSNVDEEMQINEDVIKKFLVYPRPNGDVLNDWMPGTIMAVAAMITKGLGFDEVSNVKNV